MNNDCRKGYVVLAVKLFMQVCNADFIHIRQATKICMRAECRICVIKGRFLSSLYFSKTDFAAAIDMPYVLHHRYFTLLCTDIEFVGPVTAHLYISLHALLRTQAQHAKSYRMTAKCCELKMSPGIQRGMHAFIAQKHVCAMHAPGAPTMLKS